MDVNGNLVDLAKSKVSHQYGIDERFLVYVYGWKFATVRLISFLVDQPGHSHDGSTLSYRIPDGELEI